MAIQKGELINSPLLFSAGISMEESPLDPDSKSPRFLVYEPLEAPLPYRPKYKLSVLLLILTFLSTLLVGTEMAVSYSTNAPIENPAEFLGSLLKHPTALAQGIPFAATLLGILMAHEMGHYLACRHYGIRATLPYFIPFPNLIGTMGAFIRIKSPFFNRRALFDVGVAGPISGFLLAVPALLLALPYSKLNPMQPGYTYFLFGESLIFKLVSKLNGLHFPQGMDINYHPVAMAALVGIFATALNLLPIGQLDGGHIVYSVCGRHHRIVSRIFVFAAIPLLMLFWTWWVLWAIIPIVLGLNHPPTMDDSTALDAPRRRLALVALLILALSFSPTPIRIFP